MQQGLGLEPANRRERAAGNRHHDRKALVERLAGGFIALGRVLVILAMLGTFLAWVLTR